MAEHEYPEGEDACRWCKTRKGWPGARNRCHSAVIHSHRHKLREKRKKAAREAAKKAAEEGT